MPSNRSFDVDNQTIHVGKFHSTVNFISWDYQSDNHLVRKAIWVGNMLYLESNSIDGYYNTPTDTIKSIYSGSKL